jgi:hypothetical protein
MTGAPLSLQSTIVRGADSLAEEVDGEVVMINTDSGVYYGLNAVGTRIWAMIEAPQRISDLCARLQERYAIDAATCEAEVLDLVEALRREGLIEVRGEASRTEA